MATFSTRQEPLVTCPYNPAHQVKSGRLAIHIVKCRKAYPEKDLRQCPFSADHVVPASELNQHIGACPSKNTVERFLTTSTETGGPPLGAPSPSSATAKDAPDGENWEKDLADSPATLEEKIRAPVCGPFFANVQPMTPAQRRQHYAALRGEADELLPDGKKPEVKEGSSGGIPCGTSAPKPWNLVAVAGGDDSYGSSGDVKGGDDASRIPHVSHDRGFAGATGRGGGGGSGDVDQFEKEMQWRMQLLGLGRGCCVRRN